MGEKLRQALAESEEIERNPDAVVRTDTVITRGHNRTRTLQVRLNDAELQALESVAAHRNLPVSTVAREALLRFLAAQSETPSPEAMLNQIDALVVALRSALSTPSI
ncbi:CopG family transcriptional regulator [Gordonia sp. CPCC 205515]|uniref:CopG family transcriptional regulator n=1 Tax=Gordonia sp. CPCC 205515 TaxID=3140791 RepID=UPI003AF35641